MPIDRRLFLTSALAAPMLLSARRAQAAPRFEPMVRGLQTPFGLAFLPGGGLLITERDTGVLHVRADGGKQRLKGVPEAVTRGQGGYMDIVAARDFARSRRLWLTWSKPLAGGGTGTALSAARLSADGAALEDVRTLFEMAQAGSGTRHFGSRVVEAPDGMLFLAIGDRGEDARAQDLGSHHGKILRLTPGGAPAPGNPFAGRAGARAEIWSYGHRNPQGMALDSRGGLWAVEHGAKGGDEVNRIRKGANYGWPVISYGVHYSGRRIGEGTARAGMEQPAHYWDPSMAPSGMMIYSGRLWPQWRGHIFIGSLKFDYISRLSGEDLTESERIESGETRRVRDVREAPDGSIWFLSEGRRAAYRMVPG
ncbi:Soluble aldose sugar dehydrogenase YliI precursor [Pseudoruegeria aquimaris]|uniref:Soluble aldose sugar dehydrogenase YliI n=1 Tax=Pseudoruegeria aquimaris TaxID=393663 RepID=A0A1Y5RHY5_9RHOB|nr:PQQ-dependent sugar dehydrogenase [Pseudoruegeria aquimaris]SLN17954.1 Soluble aldose sugar dehydrogenase YliI precursor [Pseudoruegeria aquimaris]